MEVVILVILVVAMLAAMWWGSRAPEGAPGDEAWVQVRARKRAWQQHEMLEWDREYVRIQVHPTVR